jgi:serine/threonine-protein kinase HipA
MKKKRKKIKGMATLLDVFLHGHYIGQLSLLAGEQTFFSFAEDYIQNPSQLVLSQSFRAKGGEIITQTRPIRTLLHPFFSNLLPEGQLRAYLAAQHYINPQREFGLIAVLGADLPGAITIFPATREAYHQDVKNNCKEISDKKSPYRFSLAGIQLKFSATVKKKGGLTISSPGGTWIVKLPSTHFLQVPENEFAIMTLAQRIGIEVPEFRLIDIKDIEGLPDLGPLQGNRALAIKRFDRGADNARIHMEDFAQVYGLYPEQKYDKITYAHMAHMVWTLCGERGLTEYIRRLVFSILIGNGDMHLKNWSFLYPDGRTPVLSPAYDLLSTVPYIPGDHLALTLVKTKLMRLCDEQLFYKLAQRAQLPEDLVLNTVRYTTEATKQSWAVLKKEIDVDQNIIAAIDKHIASVPFFAKASKGKPL